MRTGLFLLFYLFASEYCCVLSSFLRFFVTLGSLTNCLSTMKRSKCFILPSSHTAQLHACYSYHCIITHITHQTISRFEPRPNGVAPISIYFQPSHCPRWLAIDMGPNPVYNPRLALLRRKKLLMKKHTMSVMVREQIKLIAESNKRYENWPLPFVLLSRIRVRLCGFCLSLTLCLITH